MPVPQFAQLANGLRIVVVERPDLHSAAAVLHIGLGARHEQPADAGPREDRFGDDRAGQHGAELEADERDDRDQAIAECVAQHGPGA